VSLTSATSGATIYYTTNGALPTTASTVYSSPIAVASSETITAMAVASGLANSTATGAGYVINPGQGVITTIAGTGTSGFSGDGGAATSANLSLATPAGFQSLPLSAGAVVDPSGNLYFSDSVNNRVRMVTPAGIISTVAGNGAASYSGDGGTATSAALHNPEGLALDRNGNLYIADELNQRVRKVTPAGVISTFAGTGTAGFGVGPVVAATSANLGYPTGVAVDQSGNVYIAQDEDAG
jgi:sugar lactone lactonase YvrE